MGKANYHMIANSKWSLGFASHTGDFIVVIPKDNPLPARRSVTVTTAVDSQPDMKLSIYMGESSKAEDNYPLSNIRLDCIEKGAAAGVSRVKLTFYAYEHSVFRIGVCYKEGEPEQEISIIPAAGLSVEDMNRLRGMLNRMAAQVIPQEVAGLDLDVVPLSVGM
jgi:molecular chaperone DnaK (HSP70)